MDNNAAVVWTCEYCGRPLKKKTWYFGACLCRGCAFRDMLEEVFKKILLPVLLVGVAYMIANYLVTVWQITESDRLFYMWIVAGLPYGFPKMRGFFYGVGFGVGSTVAILVLNVILGGLIGGVIAAWRLVCAGGYIIKCLISLIIIVTYTVVLSAWPISLDGHRVPPSASETADR